MSVMVVFCGLICSVKSGFAEVFDHLIRKPFLSPKATTVVYFETFEDDFDDEAAETGLSKTGLHRATATVFL
jgi:hypothetical protein